MKFAFLYDAIAYGSHRAPIDFADPESYGLTGTDSICFNYAATLAKRGHDVTVFCHGASKSEHYGLTVNGYRVLDILDVELTLSKETFDVAIAVSSPNALAAFPTTTLRMVNRQVAQFVGVTQVANFDDFVDVYLCPSETAKSVVSESMPHPEKFAVLPNGCNPDRFGLVDKVPGRVIYCSSPDRGLHLLLSVWPKIRHHVPNAHLKIFYYSLDSWLGTHTADSKYIHNEIDAECTHRAIYIKHALERLKDMGVERVGGVSHRQMEIELDQAMVLGFPCDTLAFTETFSVASLEGCASGAIPVITSADSLGQIYGEAVPVLDHPIREHMDDFVSAVIRSLTDEVYRAEVIAKSKAFAAEHTWDKLTARLETIIADRSARKTFQSALDGAVIQAEASVASPILKPVRVKKPRPTVYLVLSPYGSGDVPIDLEDSLSENHGGGCRAGFLGLVRALGALDEFDITAYSTFKKPCTIGGIRYRDFKEFGSAPTPAAILAYYDTRPLLGRTGCLRIASHHTFRIPFPETFEWTDVNVVPSLDAADKLRVVFDEQAPWYVLPNAVGDMPVERRPVPGRIIYHTSPSRGLHHLIEAWPEIRAKSPGATLHVVGDVTGWIRDVERNTGRAGQRARRTKSALREAGEGITLLGRVRRDQLLQELGEASVFAFPCDVDTPCETFSVSVMECCKIGLPVVLQPADSLGSIYCRSGAVATGFIERTPGDSRRFVDVLLDVLASPKKQEELAATAKQLASFFTFESAATALKHILDDHLGLPEYAPLDQFAITATFGPGLLETGGA